MLTSVPGYCNVKSLLGTGKRFEQITSKRLLVAIDSDNFDENQFAYLTGRSATQALTLLVEELKKENLTGKSAATIFFNMSDAFGFVDRKQLMWKLGNDFEISGKLFLYLLAFLSSRKARIVLNGECGE